MLCPYYDAQHTKLVVLDVEFVSGCCVSRQVMSNTEQRYADDCYSAALICAEQPSLPQTGDERSVCGCYLTTATSLALEGMAGRSIAQLRRASPTTAPPTHGQIMPVSDNSDETNNAKRLAFMLAQLGSDLSELASGLDGGTLAYSTAVEGAKIQLGLVLAQLTPPPPRKRRMK